jgi:hypothetical protein
MSRKKKSKQSLPWKLAPAGFFYAETRYGRYQVLWSSYTRKRIRCFYLEFLPKRMTTVTKIELISPLAEHCVTQEEAKQVALAHYLQQRGE